MSQLQLFELPAEKACSKCGLVLPLDAFYSKNDKRNPGRRDCKCKECRSLENGVRAKGNPDHLRIAADRQAAIRGGRKRAYVPMSEQRAAKAARQEAKRQAAAERETERNTVNGRWNRLCASKARELSNEKDQDKWLARCQKAVSSLSSRRVVKVTVDRRTGIAVDWSSRAKSQLRMLHSNEQYGWAKRIDNAVRMLHRRTKIKQQRRASGGSLSNRNTGVQLVA